MHAAPRQRRTAERATHPGRRALALAVAFPLAILVGVFAGTGSAVAADSFPTIDDDYNGVIDSMFTSGCDLDRDGYGDGCNGSDGDGDCDDSNQQIRPDGKQYADGCTGSDVRVCAADGSGWGSCGAMVEEHLASGDDYCIDDVSGSDSNNGQFPSNCWQTFKMISEGQASDPSGWHGLVPGDVVWVKNGTYDTVFTGTGGGGNLCGNNVLCFQGTNGTALAPIRVLPWPGHSPVIDLTGTNNDEAVVIQDSSYVHFLGFELPSGGIYATGSSGQQLTGLRIYDIHSHDRNCNAANNCACISLELNGSSDIDIAFNTLHDCFDNSQPGNDNNSAINTFNGCGNVRLHHNNLSYTTGGSGTAIKAQKHLQAGCTDRYEIDGNVAIRAWAGTNGAAALKFGGPVWAHHNYWDPVVTTSGGQWIYAANLGGARNKWLGDTLIENNVFRSGSHFDFRPETDGAAGMGTITLRNNVFVRSHSGTGTGEICREAPDSMFTPITSIFSTYDNCYYTPSGAVGLNIFGDSQNPTTSSGRCTTTGTEGNGSASGANYSTLATVQAAGYETGSFDKNSTTGAFDTNGEPLDSDCLTKTWRIAGAGPTPTPTQTPTPSPTPSPTASPSPTPTQVPNSSGRGNVFAQ